MTIDIIEAARAERQSKLDQIMYLQLDVLELDHFIAKARSYAGQGETEADAEMGTVSYDGASPAQGTDGGRDAASTEPNAGGGHVTLERTTQAIEKGEPSGSPVATVSKYDLVLATLRKHPEANNRAVAKLAGVPLGTVRGYRSRALKEIAAGKVARAPEIAEEAPKPDPHPEVPAKANPAPAPYKTPMRDVALPPSTRATGAIKFRLRNPEGLYLHESVSRDENKELQVTAYRDYAWCQPEARLLKVRELHPETASWLEEIVIP